jgi:diguanylate cyclase (GGDEF)-like protein
LRDHWDIANGLPEQAATALLQDSKGFLWIGTQEGVARFDGSRFVVYGMRTSKAFHNDYVHGLAETPDGAVWVATQEGIVRIHGGSETGYSTNEGVPAPVVMSTTVSRDGTLWVGTAGGGLARFRNDRFEPVGPHSLDVRSMVAAPDGALWAGTSRAGVLRVAFSRGAPEVTPLATSGPLVAATVAAMTVDSAGDLWFATTDGKLFTYHLGVATPARLGPALEGLNVASLCWDSTRTLWIGTRGTKLWRVRGDPAAPAVESIEVGDTVSDVREDREGNIWFATIAGGLGRLSTPLLTSIGLAEGLSNAASVAVLEDRKGRVWVGSLQGLNRLTSDHSAVPVAPGLLGKAAVLALFEDREGALWVGTRNGLYRCREGSCEAEDAAGVTEDIQAFAEDADVLWIGTGRGLVRKSRTGSRLLTVADGLPHDRVSVLFRDSNGVLWVGTEAGGLARYENGSFHRLVAAAHPELSGTWALSARQEEDGSLWFGTNAGLVHVLGEHVALTSPQDLACADAFAILPGLDDDLWMSCNRGIARARRKDILDFEEGRRRAVSVSFYRGRSVGLEGECVGSVSPAGIRTRDGRLWFSTLKGVVFLDPRHVHVAPPPPVVVESLQAEEHPPVVPAAVTSFPAGTRHVDVSYTAAELTRFDDVRFRYRLDGVDETWTNAGSRRLALYPNLGPGRYEFRVEAAIEGGPFGRSVAPVVFEIRPFFYETVAFKVVLGLGTVVLAFLGYRLRVRSFAAHRRELEEIVSARTAELRRSVEDQRRLTEQMEAMADQMRERSLRDPLTGLRNRLYLSEVLEPLTRSAGNQADLGGLSNRDDAANTGVGVAMFDIDHFKEINDTYGHEAGDQVLREFAQRTAAGIRPGDVAVRWGGEEFLVALTATNPRHVRDFVERLRSALVEKPFLVPDGLVQLTCSAGYASFPFSFPQGPSVGMTDLIALADLGLYAAKRSGRDRALGVAPGPRRGVSVEMLRKALGNVDYAVQEGIIELVPSERSIEA